MNHGDSFKFMDMPRTVGKDLAAYGPSVSGVFGLMQPRALYHPDDCYSSEFVPADPDKNYDEYGREVLSIYEQIANWRPGVPSTGVDIHKAIETLIDPGTITPHRFDASMHRRAQRAEGRAHRAERDLARIRYLLNEALDLCGRNQGLGPVAAAVVVSSEMIKGVAYQLVRDSDPEQARHKLANECTFDLELAKRNL